MLNQIQKAIELIETADVLAIHAGAGMGVDSGLPDFRGNQGFWKAYPKFKQTGRSFIEMANPIHFENNPAEGWAFYGHRFNLYRETTPHEGFGMLLEIANKLSDDYFVFTSNVDGHFQEVGFASHKVEECHGSINHFQCVTNCTGDIWEADGAEISIDEEDFLALEPLPKCIHCGGVARPNVLMFNDYSWNSARTDKQEINRNSWLDRNRANKIVVIECGAGKQVPTVRMMSEGIADSIVRINPRDADGPENCLSIESGALEAIQQIYENL